MGAKTKGFTIIELLVVIVVIAILAAVTIVSYTGIQERARNATIDAAVDSWDKAIQLAAIDNVIPPPAGTCLGQPGDFPAADGFGLNQCILSNGAAGMVAFNDAAFSSWTTVSRPSGKLPVISYNADGTILKGRGLWIHTHNLATRILTIAWVAQIDGKCSKGEPITIPIEGSLTGGYCGLNIKY